MDDPRDTENYEAIYDESSGTGLLGATVRNAAILIALCLGLVYMMSGMDSDQSGPAVAGGPAADTGIQQGVLPADQDPDDLTRRAQYMGDELVVSSGPRGHFLVMAEVNGTPVRFLVDTGASSVTLTAEDAQRIGLPVHALDYSLSFHTANGEIKAAPVTLRDVRLDQFGVSDVEATVTRAPLNISLLGMSFLKRLSGYEVRPEGLIMRF